MKPPLQMSYRCQSCYTEADAIAAVPDTNDAARVSKYYIGNTSMGRGNAQVVVPLQHIDDVTRIE